MPVFMWGVLGGFLAELLKWYQLRESPNLPAYLKSAFYWGITVATILVGGLLALAYGVELTNPILAINIGLSAPLILKTLAAAAPPAPAGGGGAGGAGALQPANPSPLNFIAGR